MRNAEKRSCAGEFVNRLTHAFVVKLHEAVVKTITEPRYVESQAATGAEVTPTTPDEMRQVQIAEIKLYREIMKISGIEPE